MKIKCISLLLSLIVMLTAVLPLSSCATKPPELEDIYDRLVEVIETSHERTKIRILKTAISRVDVKAEDSLS